MKIRSKHLALFITIIPFITFYLTGHMTYMESTWDDFPLRFVLSGEDKIGGPIIFTYTDYMVHQFEWFLNFLYRIVGQFFWYDIVLCLPLITYFYLIYNEIYQSHKSNFDKVAISSFLFIFQSFLATNLHYSLSAIIGGFILYLTLTNETYSTPKNIVISLVAIIGFCIRFEFFILGFILACSYHIIFTRFKLKVFFNRKLIIFIPIIILLITHLKTALFYQPNLALNKQTLLLRKLSELSRFNVNKFLENAEVLKKENNYSNFHLIRRYLYHISPDQLNNEKLETLLIETQKFPENKIDRIKSVILDRIKLTPKSIFLFFIFCLFLFFQIKRAIVLSVGSIFLYLSFICGIEILLKPMVNRHLMGFNLGAIGLIIYFCMNQHDKTTMRPKTSPIHLLLLTAIMFISIFQANKFIKIDHIKTFHASEKLSLLENKIYLADQNFPFHSLIKPFKTFNLNGPIPVPKNWTLFHGNIKAFFRSHQLKDQVIDNLLEGNITVIMDPRNISHIEKFIQYKNPNFAFQQISSTFMPIYVPITR